MMPGLTGLQLCNLVHEAPDADLKSDSAHRQGREGRYRARPGRRRQRLRRKPFDKDELRARVEVGSA
jgi:hypothetical protein